MPNKKIREASLLAKADFVWYAIFPKKGKKMVVHLAARSCNSLSARKMRKLLVINRVFLPLQTAISKCLR